MTGTTTSGISYQLREIYTPYADVATSTLNQIKHIKLRSTLKYEKTAIVVEK